MSSEFCSCNVLNLVYQGLCLGVSIRHQHTKSGLNKLGIYFIFIDIQLKYSVIWVQLYKIHSDLTILSSALCSPW